MKAEGCGALCSQCPLQKTEDYVPPEINPGAQVVVVGDYPTEYEVKEKRPFMGPAGNEFTRYLASEGLHRGDVHWTTAVLCRPPEDRMDKFLAVLRKQNQEIKKANTKRKRAGLEIKPLIPTPHSCCLPRLKQETQHMKKFIPVGTTACKAVIHKSASVMAIRGAPTEIHKDGRMVNILATFHPAFVTKARRWMAVWRQDLHRAVKWFRTGRLHWEPPKVWYHPAPADLRRFLFSPGVAYWTYDVETDGIECLTANLRCIAIGTPKSVVLVGIRGINGSTKFYSDDDMTEIIGILKEFFEDEKILKCGHNAGYYDKIVMKEQLGIDVTPLIDTMLVHRLVESELPHNLGFVGSVYTEAPSWKTDRDGRKKAYGSETDFELHEYCAWDTAVTAEVLLPLMEKVRLRGQDKLMKCDHKLQEICAEMHTVGMYVDQKKRLEYEKHYLKEVYTRRETVREVSGRKNFNPGSTHQLRDLLFNTWRLEAPLDDKDRFTDSGDPSTADHVMRSLLTVTTLTKQQRELVTQVRLYRRAQKLLGTYVTKLRFNTEEAWGGWDEEDAWMEKEYREKYGIKKLGIVDPCTGRMYPGYNAHVTTSGRLSSSKPINAQNFPGFLRSMILAAPGHVFVGADMDQLELRIAASRWRSEKYLDAFTSGLDPHSSVTAYTVFGKRFEDAARDCGAGPFPWVTGTKFKGAAKKLRGLSKSVQYASQYWAHVPTVHRVITQTEIPDPDDSTRTLLPYIRMAIKEVRVMHEKWCQGAKFEDGWDREMADWRNQGYIEEPVMGRRRDFLDGEDPNEIVNFPIQASGASLMNIALIDLHERIPMYKWGPGTGIINQCHDSIVVECPEDQAEWVKEQIEDCMNLVHPTLPGVEFTASADIAMTWDKV